MIEKIILECLIDLMTISGVAKALIYIVIVIKIKVVNVPFYDITINAQLPIHIPGVKLLKFSESFFFHLSALGVISMCR